MEAPNVEDGIRKRIRVDDDFVYITVGHEFATVTGRFENRPDNQPLSWDAVNTINETIIELRGMIDGERGLKMGQGQDEILSDTGGFPEGDGGGTYERGNKPPQG